MISTSIIRITIANSYTLSRWKQVVALLTEKDPGSPHVHRFRKLDLIESDLNYVMRTIWGHNLIQWSEQHEAINDNKYGECKGIEAQSVALNKNLTLYIIRYYGEPATLNDNDTQVCYDRILYHQLSFALLCLGLPLNLVLFMTN